MSCKSPRMGQHWRGTAFDAKLQLGCYTKALRCISVVDQLFHHYRPPPEFGQGSDIGTIDKQIYSPPGNEKLETVIASTVVILRSARCKAIFVTTCLDTVTVQRGPMGINGRALLTFLQGTSGHTRPREHCL